MKRSSKELKAMAREALLGKYTPFVAATAIFLLLCSIISLFSSLLTPRYNPTLYWIYQIVFSFILSLLTSILTTGIFRMALCLSRGQMPNFSMLFSGFTTQPDHIIVSQLILQCIMLVISIPGYYYSYQLILYPNNITYAWLSIASSLASTMIYTLITLGFSLTLFILADTPDMGGIQALKTSWSMMRGHKGRYLYISLSFWGLAFLVCCSCFIGILFLFPYVSVTFANFYRNVRGEI